MLTRTTSRTVTFLRPSSFGAERELPAGDYLVERDEELLQGLSFPAYRCVATYLRIPGRPGSSDRMIPLGLRELEAALERDRADAR